MKASRLFASTAGKDHLKYLRKTDAAFRAFDDNERESKQSALCSLAESGDSLVSPETAKCLCGGTDDAFVHCEALLEQESIHFADKSNTTRTTTVEINLSRTDYLTLCEVELFSKKGAKLKLSAARQSSLSYSGGPAHLAIDGNADQKWEGASCSHTKREANAWWRATVHYQTGDPPARIVVYNRNILQSRIVGFRVKVGEMLFAPPSASTTRDIYDIEIPPMEHRMLKKGGGCDVSCALGDAEFCNRLQNRDVINIPTFTEFFEDLSGSAFLDKQASISADCSVSLRIFEAHFGGTVLGGGFDIEKLTGSRQQAASYSAGITGEMCLPLAKVDFLGPIYDVVEFLGVSRCPLQVAATVHPLLGTLEAVISTNLFILKSNLNITWLFEDSIRDELGVCDGNGECSAYGNPRLRHVQR